MQLNNSHAQVADHAEEARARNPVISYRVQVTSSTGTYVDWVEQTEHWKDDIRLTVAELEDKSRAPTTRINIREYAGADVGQGIEVASKTWWSDQDELYGHRNLLGIDLNDYFSVEQTS